MIWMKERFMTTNEEKAVLDSFFETETAKLNHLFRTGFFSNLSSRFHIRIIA